ncbi:MAG: NfeD family protein [Clostridia bacterium]|nr:NfeD family protein [Clostridia bacterium]
MFIIDWWNSLAIATQVFYCIAIPATLVLLIQTVLMFIGFGEDADGDVEIEDVIGDGDIDAGDGVFGEDSIYDMHDASGLEGLRIFTIRGLVAFFVVFGWVGVVMQGEGIKLLITLPVAAVCGFAMMVVIAFLFRAVMGLRNDGNTDNRNALGISGKVHLTIPPSRSGEGKVHIMLQGSYVERNAVTDSDEPILTGSEIVVVGVSGQTDLVVKKK